VKKEGTNIQLVETKIKGYFSSYLWQVYFFTDYSLYLSFGKLSLQLHFQKWPVRLGVRTPGFHPGNRGSIPLRATKNPLCVKQRGFFIFTNRITNRFYWLLLLKTSLKLNGVHYIAIGALKVITQLMVLSKDVKSSGYRAIFL
jgi:hypothetical protein